MNKKLILFSSLAALAATSVSAQSLRDGYIEWPNSSGFPGYVKAWKAGTLNMEDENFFISRVKPKQRFRNQATQVNTSYTDANDRRVCMWLPITTASEGEFHVDALPNAVFDSEAFSAWSYVDVWGDWISPHGWVPGALADVAHKNGVGVSGVASIPFGTISGDWSSCLQEQVKLNNTDVAEFLYQHGVDGLGYNSEFSGLGTILPTLAAQHGDIIEYLEGKGICTAENLWYDGTTSSGGCQFDAGLGSHNQANFGANGKRRASLFFNYNWNRSSLLTSSANQASNMGISPHYLYAGMNMQGGEPKSGDNYPVLAQGNLSLGYWGAHQYNMFWLNRTAKGSSPEMTQATYLSDTERFVSNGAHNPAINVPIKTKRNHYPGNEFCGVSAFRSAASSLCWDLADEPFVTFFNIGNGAFFNWKGERMSDNQWYNIGLQDYMPTWRYWWAPTLLGRNVQQGDVNMKATFTWDDAYMGGSCMQISGTDDDAWLHLFKTKFYIVRGDVISLTYKHVAGTGKVSLVFTTEGKEGTAITDKELTFDLTTPDDDVWVTKEIQLSRDAELTEYLAENTLALVALHVEGAENLVFDLGQFSIKRDNYATPATPKVTGGKLLRAHYQGIDGKLFWEMASNKAAGEPVYNLDVNTSMFKLYAREEGGEPVFIGATTSWAGMYFSMPFDAQSSTKVQMGVSAVSTDFASESEIAWSEPMEHPAYDVINDIALNKNVIKPNESFEISYVDPMHAPSTWTIYDSSNKEMASATGTSITVENGLANTGGYDLVIDEGTANEHRYGYYIQISSEEVGAMPEIYTVSIDGNEVTSDSEPVVLELTEGTESTTPLTVSYTGRDADGAASRGLELRERFFGLNVGYLVNKTNAEGQLIDKDGKVVDPDLGNSPVTDPNAMQVGQSFSVAFWILYNEFPTKEWSFFDITNRGGVWPKSNWGFAWHRGDANGQIFMTYRGSEDSNQPGELNYSFNEGYGKIQAKTWTHVAFTVDYQTPNKIRSQLYLNGVLQPATFKRAKGGGAGYWGPTGTEQDYADTNWALTASDWLSLGGLPNGGLAINGILDDFQIWNKAMTAEDVKTSMAGLDPENLPADVLCMWDFEDEPDADFGFHAKGSKAGVKAFSFDCVGGDDAKEGQGTQTPFEPSLNSGCPFITGTAYPIVTTPTWSTSKAAAKTTVITPAENNNGEAGSATVAFNAHGDYNLTLTLANSYGSHSVNYPVISVKDESSALEGIEAADEVEIHTDADGVFVDFPADGRYVVRVFDVQGRMVAQRADEISAGQMMRVRINNPGAYVVRVANENGKTLRTAKLIKH